MEFERVLRLLLIEFKKEEVKYGLMGGFAMGVLGIMRSTMDLDFLVDREDLSKIEKIMKKLDYTCAFSSENVSQYVSPLKVFGEVDFLHAFKEKTLFMLGRTRKIGIFDNNFKIRVLMPEDIIGLKLQALINDESRETKEYSDIESLMSLFGSDLDWGMVQEYFELFQKTDRFNTLKEHYGEAK